MLGNRKLVVDTHSEIYNLIKDHPDEIFWNLEEHTPVAGAVYVVGREQMRLHNQRLRELIATHDIKVIFSNPHEGSETLKNHCYLYGVADLVLEHKILLVGGGNMDSAWPCLVYDSILPKLLDYDENLAAMADYEQNFTDVRPSKFLLLNGRARPHRTQLLALLKDILNQGIWTNLDHSAGPIQLLDRRYECDHAVGNNPLPDTGFVKYQLFDNRWGEVYLNEQLYQDTYFSVVTETVFDYPHSFRTEKIWKPIAIGHPFIAVANAGFYRDLRNLGFQTFSKWIDETFDTIDNNQERLARIAEVIRDLCQQDLAAFIKECYNVCKYNQQHLAEMRLQVRQEFPERFFQFIRQYQFDE
jgi:hypothetical protein